MKHLIGKDLRLFFFSVSDENGLISSLLLPGLYRIPISSLGGQAQQIVNKRSPWLLSGQIWHHQSTGSPWGGLTRPGFGKGRACVICVAHGEAIQQWYFQSHFLSCILCSYKVIIINAGKTLMQTDRGQWMLAQSGPVPSHNRSDSGPELGGKQPFPVDFTEHNTHVS